MIKASSAESVRRAMEGNHSSVNRNTAHAPMSNNTSAVIAPDEKPSTLIDALNLETSMKTGLQRRRLSMAARPLYLNLKRTSPEKET